MEQALGPRGLSTPDVIKSALNKNEVAGGKLSTNAIDNLFGAPDKIVIPERYVPDAVSCKFIFHFLVEMFFFSYSTTMIKDLIHSSAYLFIISSS